VSDVTVQLADASSEAWRYSTFATESVARYAADAAVTAASIASIDPRWASLLGSPNGSEVGGGVWASGTDQAGVTVAAGAAQSTVWGVAELAGEGFNEWRQSVVTASDSDAAVTVTVGERRQLDQPIIVLHPSVADGGVASRQLVVNVGANARCTVIELHTSQTDSLYAPTTRIDIGAGATVELVSVQIGGDRYQHLGQLVADLSTGASFRATVASLGAVVSRNEIAVITNGQHAEALLRAVYFGAGDQVHDFRTLQSHPQPKSTSDLVFKGAVADRAHGIYSGMIRIDRGASGTKAYQTNRNLLLSPTASADSVPNLEIDENDVACSHASAVGPLDADQVFYLESRGVPTDIATQLIVEGFFTSVVAGTGVAGLAGVLQQEVADRLAKVEIVPAVVAGPSQESASS
jgi:Fe-S cluster assembly protein SufD